jgi:hypothetical protein
MQSWSVSSVGVTRNYFADGKNSWTSMLEHTHMCKDILQFPHPYECTPILIT